MISEGKRNEIKKEKKCVHLEKIFFEKMDLTCVLFQFMGHGAPAMAMQGLFYNQPCHYYGAALSREQLGARTTVTFPRPFFFPTSLHVPFGESFSPHLSSLLVSPLQSDATSGGHAHDAAVALGSPRALQAFLAARASNALFLKERERGRFRFF